MKIDDCGDFDEIFTHEDDDGSVRHFNATQMRDFVLTRDPSVQRTRIELIESQVEFIKQNRGIERTKVDRLVEPFLSMPVIFIEFEKGIHLTVDGHHRIVRLWEDGRRKALAYCFPLGTWEKFLVEDCETMTLQRLAIAEGFLKKAGYL